MLYKESIHIVIFTGGLYPNPKETEQLWLNMIKPEYVIAADSGIYALEEYTQFFSFFKPSLFIGDFDSIKTKEILNKYKSITKEYPTDKDYTDTELAVFYAFNYAKKIKKNAFITLIGGDGGRIDHLLNIYDSFSQKKSISLWLCKEQIVYLLKPKNNYLISNINQQNNISISRLSLSRTKGKIKSYGLNWESNLFRKKGMPSLSNRINKNQKEIKLSIKRGKFLLITPLNAIIKKI